MGRKKIICNGIIVLIFVSLLIILEGTCLGQPGIQKYAVGFKVFDMQLNYDVKMVYESLLNMQKKSIEHYKIYLFFDTWFAVFFAMIQLIISENIYGKLKRANMYKAFLVLIIIRVLCDFCENSCLFTILKDITQIHYVIVHISNVFTRVKFLSMIVFIVLLVGIYVFEVIKKYSSKEYKNMYCFKYKL